MDTENKVLTFTTINIERSIVNQQEHAVWHVLRSKLGNSSTSGHAGAHDRAQMFSGLLAPHTNECRK